VADAVGDRTEIICDGGVRRGSDIVKALALGAKACMSGRAYLYGLGAAGEAGVDHVLDLLSSDMRRTMALVGCSSVADIDRDHVRFTPQPGPPASDGGR
jgi:L-lactate dehydrogenase (cytochrome)